MEVKSPFRPILGATETEFVLNEYKFRLHLDLRVYRFRLEGPLKDPGIGISTERSKFTIPSVTTTDHIHSERHQSSGGTHTSQSLQLQTDLTGEVLWPREK